MKKQELIYGIHAVKTLLKTRPSDVIQLIVQEGRQDQRVAELTEMASAARIPCETVSKNKLQDWFKEGQNHQGIVAKCKPLSAWTENELFECIENATDRVVLLILDGVQDPHNLGACMRSANAFGVTAVIAPKDRAATLTDVVKKVACGAAEHTPFVAVTNLHRTIKQVQERGVWLVGLDSEGTLALADVDLKGNIGIVMGSEGQGLRRLTKEACDYLAKIPMQGMVESLNVSVATGIALYETRRQKR